MNKRALNIIAVCFLMMTAASCKKWLDLKPQDGITRQDFWKTKEQVQSAVIGCYSSLLGSPVGGTSLSETLFYGEN